MRDDAEGHTHWPMAFFFWYMAEKFSGGEKLGVLKNLHLYGVNLHKMVSTKTWIWVILGDFFFGFCQVFFKPPSKALVNPHENCTDPPKECRRIIPLTDGYVVHNSGDGFSSRFRIRLFFGPLSIHGQTYKWLEKMALQAVSKADSSDMSFVTDTTNSGSPLRGHQNRIWFSRKPGPFELAKIASEKAWKRKRFWPKSNQNQELQVFGKHVALCGVCYTSHWTGPENWSLSSVFFVMQTFVQMGFGGEGENSLIFPTLPRKIHRAFLITKFPPIVIEVEFYVSLKDEVYCPKGGHFNLAGVFF